MMALFPVMRIFAAALSDVAYAALVGVLLNRLWLGRSVICDRRLCICLRACSVILLVDIPLQFALLSASMIGDTSWADAWHAIPDVADTHSGRVMMASVCLVPFLLAFTFFSNSLKKRRNILIGLALFLALIACRAPIGHSASDGDFTLREGIPFLHLSSIATWGGGILVAGLITIPQLAPVEPDSLEQFGRNLSRTVTIALSIVILSGIYNSWKELGGSLSPLPHSVWGRMLLLKLSFVLIALGHGVRVRVLLRKHQPWTQSRTTIMKRWVRVEAFFMLLILVCSAWLANLPPAHM
jgi:putative copper resistance protein D